jgi:hypothetical protein
MIIANFGGWNIVNIPTSPALSSLEFTAVDTVAVSVSPFSNNQQVQDWQSSFLTASATLPPMTNAQAQPWIAWNLQLHGRANTFQLGDPLMTSPQGSPSGTPLTNGTQSGYSLITDGWTASHSNLLLPGDWVQIGYRLYRNIDPVNSDSSGNATLNIWPQIRESPSNNSPLILSNTKGLWRLKSNSRKWSMTNMKLYGMQFEIVEAL